MQSFRGLEINVIDKIKNLIIKGNFIGGIITKYNDSRKSVILSNNINISDKYEVSISQGLMLVKSFHYFRVLMHFVFFVQNSSFFSLGSMVF